ncbi:WASH complex subunit 3-like [Styela clava]
MDDVNLPALGPTVDLTKMAPLNQRRSVTFMNHFITHTANFLNKFSNMAEEKLALQSLEMQRMEIALNILEAKLSSIPGLDDVKKEEPSPTQPASTEPVSTPTPNGVEAPPPAEDNEPPAPDPNVVLVKNDARYAKYLKMVMVGVPKMAVANKMRAEGLDPDMLDTPDAPVPDGGQAPTDEDSDNESQSLSSNDDFSD